MKSFNFKALTLAVCTGAALSLAACGSDNDDNNNTTNTAPASTETIKGMAATGKPFAGKVIVKNKDGKESAPVVINADGSFEVAAPKGGPYLIKAYNDKTGDQAVTLYSYSADAKTNVNVNQLTTQAVFTANGQANLDTLYSDWAKQSSAVTQAKIEEAAKQVAANLNNQFAAVNIDAKKLNIFSYDFKADGTGFDSVLDNVQISGFNNCTISSCSVQYTVNGTNFSWNYQISTNGYSWVIENPNGGFGGNYNLKVTTSVNGFGTTVDIKGVPKPANQQEFCGDADIKEQLPAGYVLNSCSFSGNTGNIAATVSANGFSVSYSVKYEYTPA
ncbi:carboxypeptidase regulatory-like domain-containing protein [Alkanindiges illinoisensis]|uniref:carboxypeptidase regulatory-like domain-containing protein n=1 Tax=Alkanindiges illinoisensis TaxID=197183 RepID=UPI001F0F704D|nr:carboxypeptidase regulatory-like domain-containing protein [Alkanindiges illinoisensis]